MIKIVKRQEEANCITHSGTMHADEVFATAFLENLLKDIKVFRTTNVDFDLVRSNTLVYDVGRREFDHHQLDALKRDNGITYCSFGLLWKAFGKKYLKQEGFSNVDSLWEYIDKDFVEGIDADDNGVFPKIDAIYKVKTLSSVIKLFNPSFDSEEEESTQFLKAVRVAKEIFNEEVLFANGKVIANKKVNDILDNISSNSKYLILDEFIPYEEALLNRTDMNNLLFVAFPSNRGGYAIKTIPKSLEDKTARCEFPEEWGGLSEKELESASGIDGMIFCHTGRFITSCKNLDTVLKVFNKLCN